MYQALAPTSSSAAPGHSILAANTPPATHLNKKLMDSFRPELKKYYYDPSRYKSYLEQLGIQYPQLIKKN